MALVKKTDRKHTLEYETAGERNKWFAFVGLLGLAVGALAVGGLIHRLTYTESVTCERNSTVQECTHLHGSSIWGSETSARMDEITGVAFRSDREPPLLVVLRDQQPLKMPLRPVDQKVEASVSELRALVSGDATGEVTIRRGYSAGWLGPTSVALLFIGGGLGLLYQMTWTTVRLTGRRLELERRRLVGGVTREVMLDDIDEVTVASREQGRMGSSGAITKYRVVIRTTDGESIPLTSYDHTDREQTEANRDDIRDFVGRHA